MEEIDQEELIGSFESVINHFDDMIEPYAIEISKKLSETFKKLVKQDLDDRGESMMAASGCLSVIRRILSACQKHPNVLSQIEEQIYPLILYTCCPKGLEYIEDAIDCSVLLVYHQKTVSPKMWSLYEKFIDLILGDKDDEEGEGGILFDSIQIIQSFLQNCIKYGGEGFFSHKDSKGRTPVELIMNFVPDTITIARGIDPSGMQEAAIALKTLSCVFENHFGKVDYVLEDTVGLLMEDLNSEDPLPRAYKSFVL